MVSEYVLSTTILHWHHISLFYDAGLQFSFLYCLDKLLDELMVVQTCLLHFHLEEFELHFLRMVAAEIFEEVLRSCFNILACHLVGLEVLWNFYWVWHRSAHTFSPTRFCVIRVVSDLLYVSRIKVLYTIFYFLVSITVKLAQAGYLLSFYFIWSLSLFVWLEDPEPAVHHHGKDAQVDLAHVVSIEDQASKITYSLVQVIQS